MLQKRTIQQLKINRTINNGRQNGEEKADKSLFFHNWIVSEIDDSRISAITILTIIRELPKG